MKINFKGRLKEINFFISCIPNVLPSEKNLKMIDANIRASIILLCSHFEGILKELIKCYIEDINNKSLACSNLETITYVRNIIGKNIDTLSDINKLTKTLEEYHFAINSNSIIKLDYKKFNDTKSNPSPEIVIKLFNSLGFKNIIDELNMEHFSIVPYYDSKKFLRENEKQEMLKFIDESTLIQIDNILTKSRVTQKQLFTRGYYKDINDLLLARNEIVHGNSSYKLTLQDVIKLKKNIFKLLLGIYKKLDDKLI